MSVARSSSDMFTIGRIAYRLEGVFFPTENALSAGKEGWEWTARAKYAIYDCLVFILFCVYFAANKFVYLLYLDDISTVSQNFVLWDSLKIRKSASLGSVMATVSRGPKLRRDPNNTKERLDTEQNTTRIVSVAVTSHSKNLCLRTYLRTVR